ncbi:MAG: CHASE2 domain-containing protein [Cyanobacteriota bacterium]
MKHKLFISILIITLILSFFELFKTFDNKVYDYFIVINQERTINQNIIIVEIDNKSIKEIGYWPWNRKIYKDCLQNIIASSPAVIGIYLTFSYSQGDYKQEEALYNMLKSFPDLVINADFDYYSDNSVNLLVPNKGLYPDIKKTHSFYIEKDIIREIPPFKILPAFSLYVLKLYYNKYPLKAAGITNKLGHLLNNITNTQYSVNENLLINYKRTPDKFKHISFVDVLNNKFKQKDFQNRIVLIGITDKFLTHFFATPFITKKENLSSSSVEINAQILDSLMSQNGYKENFFYLTVLFTITIAVAYYFLSKKSSIIIQGVWFVLFLITIFLCSFLFFKYTIYWIPPVSAIFFVVVIFIFHIFITVSNIDTSLLANIKALNKDENITLSEIPTDINDKIDLLNSLINVISLDRQTIKAIINGVNSGIIVVNTSGNILWTNEQFLSLFEEKNILNNNIQDLINDLTEEELNSLKYISNAFKKELTVNKKDFLCVFTPINNNHFAGIFNDITELKEVDRLKTELMRMVSHELKTPITNIMLATEDIIDFDDRNRTINNTHNIFEFAQLMQNIITNFLNLNKLEHNLMDVIIEETDILNVINRSIELQIPFAETKDVQIIVEYLDKANTKVLADKKLLEIVFNNLISNAIKYSKPFEKVVVILRPEGDFLVISVVDNGVGISKEEQKHIFEKFYRAKNNKLLEIKGTGLGLSIVSMILNLHNSIISLQSEENNGSSFSFKLPINKSQQNASDFI